MLPSRYKPWCVRNSIVTSSSILRKVRTCHRRTFSCFQKMEDLAGKRFANDEDLKDTGWISRRPHGMKRVWPKQTGAKVWQVFYCQRRLCRKVDNGMSQNLYIPFLYYYYRIYWYGETFFTLYMALVIIEVSQSIWSERAIIQVQILNDSELFFCMNIGPSETGVTERGSV